MLLTMHLIFSINWIRQTLIVPTFFLATHAATANDLAKTTQDTLSKWISVEKTISEDKGEWIAQKEILHSSIEFMKGELTRLEERIETAKTTASAGEKKRAELNETKAKYDSVMAEIKKSVTSYEATVEKLAKGWPAPFLDTVDVFLKRIPTREEADKAALTVRLQNVVAILSQFDKFQGMITKVSDVQEIEGSSLEVTTLYYGFAYAYFVDAAGAYAGYGYPADGGWTWVADKTLAKDVGELVKIFERSAEARFIALPAKVVTP